MQDLNSKSTILNGKTAQEKLRQQEEARNHFTKAIIESSASKKIIVSGPGTGKTFLFHKVLKQKTGDCLVLTFINNLANKLNGDLGREKITVCTFHSFCKSLLHRIPRTGINSNFTLYPKLSLLIKSDALILLRKELDFRHSFTKLDRNSEELKFFIKRSNYYNAVSFDDSVFRVIEYFEQNPDGIPKFDQILVDEYQDFNLLEVTFIDLIGKQSPLLIVGDDDQALYGQLKDASSQYIRTKYRSDEYEHFELPFCSRCTKVIVDAIQDILINAKSANKLSGRVNKRYICYLPEKLDDNRKYPKILHAHCSIQSKQSPYLSRFIEQEIKRLEPEEIKKVNEKADFTVLITGPHHYLKQINSHIEKNKEWQIDYRKQDNIPPTISISEGYKILTEDMTSNLGWRIVLECDRPNNLEEILRKTHYNKTTLHDNIPQDHTQKHEAIIKLLEKVKQEEKTKNVVKDNQQISVALTTYVGCKGLSAGYVFAVGLNEGILPKKNQSPTDIEICQMIVILTRTVKECYLISVDRFAGQKAGSQSVFLRWINNGNFEEKSINKNYLWDKQNLI